MSNKIEICFFCKERCIDPKVDTSNYRKSVGDLKELTGHIGKHGVCSGCAADLEKILVLRIANAKQPTTAAGKRTVKEK